MPATNLSVARNLRTPARALAVLLAVATCVAAAEREDPSRRLAKVTAVQNAVDLRRAGSDAWNEAGSGEALFGGDRVRTGPASRAAILYADDTLQRVDEKSEIEIVAPEAGRSGGLRVLTGRHYFASRKPKNFGRVETSTVTAAIKGTEFAVDVAEDGTTTVTMIEGVVVASNELGSVEVVAGERAVAEPGKAPVRSVVVRPRDAVAWALYYPPVLAGTDAERLRGLGADGAALEQVAQMLAAGRVEEAKSLLDTVRQRLPSDPVALSLAAVMALAGDRKEEARGLAGRALEADPGSAAAALAASFVAQADFQISRAAELAEQAAESDPGDPTALARVAELRMAQGDLRGARRAAEDALRRAPEDARALTVLGFVELARLRSAAAESLFERAVAADPGLAMSHLGLGIARLRRGNLGGGREEMQAAVSLDPGNSLLRSYLGKAFYEEKRSAEALQELGAAKEIDPLDPTPWLYSAILLQSENRPVEALEDLLESMDRNDNRAVYRSRLLLDEDAAVRSADLARIFNDLGFEEAGLVAARRSADEDQANHSGHLLLAGNYRYEPWYAPAFLSEVLQARIYQPVNANAARPDVVNASASFNEYAALFDRPRVRAFGAGALGSTGTDLGKFACNDPFCFDTKLDDGDIRQGEMVVTGGGDRYAAALSYSSFSDDGFRLNTDEDNEVWRGFLQVGVSDRDTIQFNAIRGERETGELPLRQSPFQLTGERFDTTETNLAFGWHRSLGPGSDLAVSAIWNETEQVAMTLAGIAQSEATLDGPQVEAQWVKRTGRATWITGAGAFDGTVEMAAVSGPRVEADDTFLNGYVYAKLRGFGPVDFTVGASVEDVETPVGFLPPRDSGIFAADLPYTKTVLSPKLGVTATFSTGTTLRAGAYHRLAPFLGRLQTLEPTQVAGFNQFFEDPGGTRSWSYGAGIDQRIGRRLFLGASYVWRNLTVPEAYCDRQTEWSQFSGCAGFVPSVVEQRDRDDQVARAYVSATLARSLSATVAYDYEESEFDTTFNTLGAYPFQDRLLTQRLRPEIRWFSARGFFVRVGGTRYDQEADQFEDLSLPDRTVVESSFWVADAAVGYRFPKRWGSFVVDGRNLLDKKFAFYQRSIQERVVPARSVVARLEITY